jgi:hypothetical protein
MHRTTPAGRYGDADELTNPRRVAMTDTREAAVISEALAVIDKALGEMLRRELVSSGEVADVLLDVRTLLVNTGAESQS